MAFALLATDPSSIPDTPHAAPAPLGVIPEPGPGISPEHHQVWTPKLKPNRFNDLPKEVCGQTETDPLHDSANWSPP